MPTLHAGAADAGAIDLTRILDRGGHRAIVVSRGGRLEGEVAADVANSCGSMSRATIPIVMLRSAFALARLARERRCDLVHAHGRAAAWSAWLAARMAGIPLLTTWYKGFREQNLLKRLYNSVMVRGERVIAVSDQIAELIVERHRVAPERIAVVPASIDADRFDPAAVSAARLDAIRRAWGVTPDTKVILVVGRMLRRKGHHVAVKAVHRLKQRGLKDFVCVFAGEDQGRTRYTGELWDLISATGTADVVRLGRRGRRHAGGLCGRDRRGLGRRAGGRAAARDPRGAGHGAPGRGVRSGGRTRGGAGAAGGSRGAHDRAARPGGRRGGARRGAHPLVFIER